MQLTSLKESKLTMLTILQILLEMCLTFGQMIIKTLELSVVLVFLIGMAISK